MSEHPVMLLTPFYKWLDWVIAEHGLYLYTAAVWLSPLLIVWILKGGFWRRSPKPPRYILKPPLLPPRPVAGHCRRPIRRRTTTASPSSCETQPPRPPVGRWRARKRRPWQSRSQAVE